MKKWQKIAQRVHICPSHTVKLCVLFLCDAALCFLWSETKFDISFSLFSIYLLLIELPILSSKSLPKTCRDFRYSSNFIFLKRSPLEPSDLLRLGQLNSRPSAQLSSWDFSFLPSWGSSFSPVS